MNPVATIAALQEAMGRIERVGADFGISFFASVSKIETWIAEGTLGMLPREGALLISRRDGKLLRVSHVAADRTSLADALGHLVEAMPGQLMVADIVGRPEHVEAVARTYQQQGFVRYSQLVRMQRRDAYTLTTEGGTDVELACLADAPRLRDFMEHWLDPLSEQIPSEAELRLAIASESVFVVRDGCGLAGILVHETAGQSATLRYWHVAGDQHGRGIGSRLMHAFLARCATSRRVTLWVLSDNIKAIDKYHHYGFNEDGMIDIIMVRQATQVAR
jgi:ribosomal protein S18 acetylase RimI-like enzyme